MSSIDHTKKIAKRLFSLAKENSVNQTKTSLPIKNLSAALDIVSKSNGFKTWHDYKSRLSLLDLKLNKTNIRQKQKLEKEIHIDEKFFLQETPIIKERKKTNLSKITETIITPHIPINIGSKKSEDNNVNKYWQLDQYPFYIQGNTGSGQTSTVISFANKYINNKEGLIYVSGRGDNTMLSKISDMLNKNDRITDLYCIDFLINSRSAKTYTIDPINSMFNNQLYFETIFGKSIGRIIHEEIFSINQQGFVLNLDSLYSLIMIKNIIKLSEKNNQAKRYLEEINYSGLINEEIIQKHTKLCQKAYFAIQQLLEHKQCFSHNPSVDLEKIFNERKVLLINLPSLYKLNLCHFEHILNIISNLIFFTDCDLKNKTNNFHQNIIIDEYNYLLNDQHKHIQKILFESPNNYIISTSNPETEKKDILDLISICKTALIMKTTELKSIPITLKLKAIESIDYYSPVFFSESSNDPKNRDHKISQLKIGTGYIFGENTKIKNKNFINNDHKYYIEKIECCYIK